jgi:3-hydroxyacyl-CoA dehydrogenase
VVLVETKQEALDRGLGVMRKNYENTAKRGTPEAGRRREAHGAAHRLARARTPLADCDLVIEAVFENMAIKKEVFAQARPPSQARRDPRHQHLLSRTSTRSPRHLASGESVLGMHFFSPANVMRLLEIVRGRATAVDVIATAMKLARTIGKVGVVVGNCHGFVGNRMLAARNREADRLVLEGALPWDVDRVLYDFGFPMGPFRMRDLAGLDIGWDAAKSSSSTVRELLCEMGRRGQKTGAGYYDHDAARNAAPSAVTERLILDFAARQGVARRAIADEEILERCLYPMVNEGAKILDEGIAARASDIDTVWLCGYGWPRYRGGPMFWAEFEGLPGILGRLRALQQVHGEEFRPAPLLERLVTQGRGFRDFAGLDAG